MGPRVRGALGAALVPVVAWLANACGTSSEGDASVQQDAAQDAFQGDGQSALDAADGQSALDAADGQSALDAADAEDGGLDVFAPDAFGADAGDASGEHDINQTSNWSTFDLTGLVANAKTFAGAAFDGRYVYLAPGATGLANAASGVVPRYDTQGPFASAASWSTFGVTSVDANAVGFIGATFDGRYVYFAPDASYSGSVVARYDTQATFVTASSWATFDTTTIDANAKRFVGSTFDGRYLYFIPNEAGLVARLDTQGAFGSPGAWTTFDARTLNASVAGFAGGVFDGRYVYLAPGNLAQNGIAARYDTQAAFGASASWTTFDTRTLNAKATGAVGAAFDGRYVYFVPNGLNGTDGVMVRYDPQAAFTIASSWTAFDLTGVNAGAWNFRGAVFDGRRLHFPQLAGLLASFDTTASFTSASSWTVFDTKTVSPNAFGFFGGVFDGRYAYFVPQTGSVVARFDARSTTVMPNLPAFYGSFL